MDCNVEQGMECERRKYAAAVGLLSDLCGFDRQGIALKVLNMECC